MYDCNSPQTAVDLQFRARYGTEESCAADPHLIDELTQGYQVSCCLTLTLYLQHDCTVLSHSSASCSHPSCAFVSMIHIFELHNFQSCKQPASWAYSHDSSTHKQRCRHKLGNVRTSIAALLHSCCILCSSHACIKPPNLTSCSLLSRESLNSTVPCPLASK